MNTAPRMTPPEHSCQSIQSMRALPPRGNKNAMSATVPRNDTGMRAEMTSRM